MLVGAKSKAVDAQGRPDAEPQLRGKETKTQTEKPEKIRKLFFTATRNTQKSNKAGSECTQPSSQVQVWRAPLFLSLTRKRSDSEVSSLHLPRPLKILFFWVLSQEPG